MIPMLITTMTMTAMLMTTNYEIMIDEKDELVYKRMMINAGE